MRNLEFRVWNNDLKRYFYINGDNSLMIAESNCTVALWCNDGIYDEVQADAIELFTGITDKNGIKVFEGDIVDCLAVTRGGRSQITRHLAGETVSITSVDGVMFGIFPYRSCGKIEVTGNIREKNEK